MPSTDMHPTADDVAVVRRFNRFYTTKLGVLGDTLLNSAYSPPEARLIYELAQEEGQHATLLSQRLGLDPGYLSRLLGSLESQGVLVRARDPADGRRVVLKLSAKGRRAFDKLNVASAAEVSALLSAITPEQRQQVKQAMATIESVFTAEDPDSAERPRQCVLRSPVPGDYGWVIQQHGALYAAEYHWDARFEALVAGIVSQIIESFDPLRERWWIAECDGQTVGSVCVVRASDTVAKLRLLLVHPSARGLGLGRQLVREAIQFARQTGYERLDLWTNSILSAARGIYESEGFMLVKEERHQSFGHDLVGETWQLPL